MDRRAKLIAGGVLAVALVGGAAGIAGAAGGDGGDGAERPITGPALDAASAAALRHTGGGRVTETEVGDEDGAYEVEVTLPDGRSVDVHLDRDFRVIDSRGDRDRAGADDADNG